MIYVYFDCNSIADFELITNIKKYLFFQVSYPPYLFECLLFAPVEEDSSTAKVGNGVVDFVFPKKELVLWGQLQSLDAGKNL